MKLFLSTISIFILFLSSANADEYTVNLAPAWWEYQEDAPKIAGFTSTPFKSKANGFGIMGGASGEFNMIYDTKLKISGEGLFTLIKPKEYWFGLPAHFQVNDLSIQQWEIFTSISHEFFKNEFNLWFSYQSQTQDRSNFVGFPTISNIKETKNIIWGGLGWSKVLYKDFRFSIMAGTPIMVDVNNSRLGKVGNKKSGYRARIGINAPLPWTISGGSMLLDFSYSYKKVGGQKKGRTYWPKNTFQVVMLGILIYW